ASETRASIRHGVGSERFLLYSFDFGSDFVRDQKHDLYGLPNGIVPALFLFNFLGYSHTRVWSTDWFQNPAQELRIRSQPVRARSFAGRKQQRRSGDYRCRGISVGSRKRFGRQHSPSGSLVWGRWAEAD